MKVRVKICGIKSLQDALMCAGYGAQLLGFVFYDKSPRCIDPHKAAEIIGQLPASVTPVGIFVNESRETISNIISTTRIRIVQLSGDEVPADCLGYGVEVWKAFRLRHPEEASIVSHYTVAAAMLDGARDGAYGGTGTAPNCLIALEMKKFHPLVLAGGLRPENIASILRQVHPAIIDVSSGVELIPGVKDAAKVRLLFQALRSTDF